jgi:hypothetical protein
MYSHLVIGHQINAFDDVNLTRVSATLPSEDKGQLTSPYCGHGLPVVHTLGQTYKRVWDRFGVEITPG